MTRRDYFLLYLAATVFYAVLTLIVRAPGYMDAEYYYAGGIQLVSGHGLFEPYLWNYLSSPGSLPVHAFSYWMPLSSYVAAAGMWLSKSTAFAAARLIFILAAGLIPLITAKMAEDISPRKGSGWLAGSIALFSAYYLIHLTTTDSFVLMMILGSAFLYLVPRVLENTATKNIWLTVIGFGVVSGLLHLARTDGILWFFAGFSLLLLRDFGLLKKPSLPFYKSIVILLVFVASYLLVMGSWYWRNLSAFQSLFPPGNNLMLFAVEYNDIFFFKTADLGLPRLMEAGIGAFSLARVKALFSNLLSFIGVNGSILLSPFIVIGLWQTRRSSRTRVAVVITLLILVLMSIVFPFAGTRGGFFHSMAAFQPFFWSLVPLGLLKCIELGVQKRKWQLNRSWKLLGTTFLAAVSIVSILVFMQKLNSSDSAGVPWNESLDNIRSSNQEIVQLTGDQDSVIMVNDPPGYWLATGRRAVVIPSDSLESLQTAATKFDVRFVIIEQDNRKILEELTLKPALAQRLRLISGDEVLAIYEIQ